MRVLQSSRKRLLNASIYALSLGLIAKGADGVVVLSLA